MELCYARCLILLNSVIVYQGCFADEIRDMMFKLITNENNIISNERRIDALETQFKSSMEDLNTKLSTELNKITVTLKQYEPGMGEIRKAIQDTISNTVTQTVRSQYVILSKAMKQEKAAILKTRSEVKQQMRFMNTAFNNSQRHYEERFTNQTAQLQDEFNTQKEKAEDLMKKELNESDEHMHEQIQTFENVYAKNTDTLNSAFHMQTETVNHLFKTLLNESEQLHKMVESYREETKNTTQSLEDELKETLKTMKNELLENLNEETSSLQTRFTKQENAQASQNVQLMSQLDRLRGNLRSYKSSSDAIGSRVSSIERRMTSSSAFTATGSVPYGSSRSIRFPDVKLNEGNDYNSATGVFTCRVPGLYIVTASIGKYYGNNVEGARCKIQLNGVNKLYLYHHPYGEDRDAYSPSKTGTFRLQVNDRINVGDCIGREHIWNSYATSFSAVLIRPDQL